MHKIFGRKENVIYTHREGVYLIPIQNKQVGVVQTPKGYFLLGGGLEEGETHKACIIRECMEEAGYGVEIGERICTAETYGNHPTIGYFHPMQTYYIGKLTDKICDVTEQDHQFMWIEQEKLKGNLFSKMQNWALEQCLEYVRNQKEVSI